MKLEDILQAFDDLKLSFRHHTNHGDMTNKNALIEFQGKFIDLKTEIRPHKNSIYREFRKRTDKNATAIKARIANAIANCTFEEFEKASFSKARELAAASSAYETFLDQRQFYETSYYNLVDLREDIYSYINEIKDRIKN